MHPQSKSAIRALVSQIPLARFFYRSELLMLWALRSLTGCAVGVGPSRSPQRRPAADLLSCQLIPFPRVPQSERPSESVSANTQGGEAGEKCLDSCRAAKHQRLNNCWRGSAARRRVWVLIAALQHHLEESTKSPFLKI